MIAQYTEPISKHNHPQQSGRLGNRRPIQRARLALGCVQDRSCGSVRAVCTESGVCRRKKLSATCTEHTARRRHNHHLRGGRHEQHRPWESTGCCPCRRIRAPTVRMRRSAVARSVTTSPANTVSNSSDNSESKTRYNVARTERLTGHTR